MTSAYARLGNDIGSNQSFRIGAYVLNGSSVGRSVTHGHGDEADVGEVQMDDHEGVDDDLVDDHGDDPGDAHMDDHEGVDDDPVDDHGGDPGDADMDGHESEEDHDLLATGVFAGDTTLYGVDVRYSWAPTGNPSDQLLTLQGEYFWRNEQGVYSNDEGEMAAVDGTSSSWYLQGTYKFNPAWRLGLRYSHLNPISAADMWSDEHGLEHNPSTASVMAGWTGSEFGRIRLQYNRETLTNEETDNQLYLQYLTIFGAHGARAH